LTRTTCLFHSQTCYCYVEELIGTGN
jgi:hypothetical protein